MDSNHRYPEREACFFPGRNSLAGTASRRGRASVSGLWKEGAGSGFGEVAGAGRLDQASGSSLRRRSGAGLGDYSRRRSLLGLVRPDRDRQARRSYAAAVNKMSAAGPGLISRLEARRSARAPSLQGDPEELPHLRRQIVGGNVAGHAQHTRGPSQGWGSQR